MDLYLNDILLELNIDYNDETKYITVMHYACYIGDFELVKCLIENNILIDYDSMYNAIHNKHINILHYLIEHNNDLKRLDNMNNTYLHYTVINNLFEASKLLVEKGCDVNAKNKDNLTPLHCAMFTDNSDLIEFLINLANLNILDHEKNTLLHTAAKRDNIRIITLLLDKGLDVNALNVYNETPIFNTIKIEEYERVVLEKENRILQMKLTTVNNLEIFKLFVNRGALITLQDVNNNTLLHFCKHVEIFKLLLEYDFDVNHKNNNGFTSLHIASEKGNLEIINMLIDKGALLNIKTRFGDTPLHYAIQNEHEDASKLLIDKGADVNSVDNKNVYPIHRAINISSLSIIKHLIEHGADIDVKNNNGLNILSVVCCHNDIEIIKYLFKENQVNEQSHQKFTPLYFAIFKGNLDVVKFLIDHNADVNIKDEEGKTPIYTAVLKGYIHIVQYLIDHGADLYFDKSDPNLLLHTACTDGYNDIMDLLINKGMDVNSLDKDGNTLLYKAAYNNYLDVVKCLIKNNADVTIKITQYTPLHCACFNENVEMIKCLVEHAKDKTKYVNEGLANKQSSLHIVVEHKNIKLIKYLISNGALVNLKDISGNTPLHIAMYYYDDHYDDNIIRYLVYANSDINIKNDLDESSLDIAKRKNITNLMYIEKVNETYVDKEESCKVCLQPYEDKKTITLYCKHKYCVSCVEGLQNNNINTCPTCKRFCYDLI